SRPVNRPENRQRHTFGEALLLALVNILAAAATASHHHRSRHRTGVHGDRALDAGLGLVEGEGDGRGRQRLGSIVVIAEEGVGVDPDAAVQVRLGRVQADAQGAAGAGDEAVEGQRRRAVVRGQRGTDEADQGEEKEMRGIHACLRTRAWIDRLAVDRTLLDVVPGCLG
ncbi:hypothetical protein F4780DRAFT_795416, partial [Xylariomycetidae sp. FL0641]